MRRRTSSSSRLPRSRLGLEGGGRSKGDLLDIGSTFKGRERRSGVALGIRRRQEYDQLERAGLDERKYRARLIVLTEQSFEYGSWKPVNVSRIRKLAPKR
jgi:hypothetical protein